MPSRRRVLSGCVTGVAAVVAGCFGGDGDGTPTDAATDAPTDATTGTGTTTPTATGSGDVIYENEWTGVTIERGSGWIHETPKIGEFAELSYTVTAADGASFDVYVFGEEYTKDTYEEWINAPSGMRPEDGGIVGESGAVSWNATGKATSEYLVSGGGKRYWVAVDHSDFHGGTQRATVSGDSPEVITVDISIRIVPALG